MLPFRARSLQCAFSRQETLLLLVAVAALAMGGWRVWFSFQEQAPAWLKPRTMKGPALNFRVFRPLLDKIEQEAAARNTGIREGRLMELRKGLKETHLWQLELLVNPGFSPMREVERSPRADPARFLGYYDWRGTPLAFTTKQAPAHPGRLYLTLHLGKELAAGATQRVFRVERRADQVKTSKNGEAVIALGRLQAAAPGLQFAALALPSGVSCKRYAPLEGSFLSRDPAWCRGWCSAWMPANASPVVAVVPE